MTPEEILASVRDRKTLKKRGAELDRMGRTAKQAIVDLAAARGVSLPADAASWPGKKLLRRAQGRSAQAQVRKNPIARDEEFECVGCGRLVPAHGRSARDHCPYCLVGLHVDGAVPGDRSADCGGVLRPVSVRQENQRWMLAYRCDRCGATRRNQVLQDGDPPDSWALVVKLAGTGA